MHFLLCEFRNTTDELPDINTSPAHFEDLYRNSTSPNDEFGFLNATYYRQTLIKHR